MQRTAAVALLVALLAGCVSADVVPSGNDLPAPAYEPHVILGSIDTGINPYHEIFYRPDRTMHPCTYIEDFPCSVRELRLHVGGSDWNEAFAADRETWASLEEDVWYWIPQTAFVAVMCTSYEIGVEGPRTSLCLLDDQYDHGSATTSVAAMQAPDTLLAFYAGGDLNAFRDGGIPVDVYSVSLGRYPIPSAHAVQPCESPIVAPLVFQSAGNDAAPIFLDCSRSVPTTISVGGGYTEPYAHDAISSNGADIESHFCPPWAANNTVTGLEPAGSWCGTSFAAPIAAAAASRAILELRRATGYTGGLTDEGVLDARAGVTIDDLRAAIFATASYTPAPRFPITQPSLFTHPVPLNPAAPWLQWGWGFYDSDAANATLEVLLGAPAPEKPEAARLHMAAMHAAREAVHGSLPTQGARITSAR